MDSLLVKKLKGEIKYEKSENPVDLVRFIEKLWNLGRFDVILDRCWEWLLRLYLLQLQLDLAFQIKSDQ